MSGGLDAVVSSLAGVADRVWPVLLFLVLIQVVADLCDDAGLFDVGAHLAARFGRGSRLLLFVLFCSLATACTWVLSIDTTAVLLAPIGLALASELGLSPLPFAFASIWLANTASLLLPVSNLTNLLAQERLRLDPVAFVQATWVPQLAVLAAVLLVLLVRHRAALRGRYDVPRELPEVDRVLVRLAAVVVLLIGPAVVLGVPAWLTSLVAVVALVAGFAVRRPAAVAPRRLLSLVPWSVLVFAVVLFVVVDLLVTEARPLLTATFGSGGSLADLGQLAGVTVVLANVVNNLPAYLVVEPFAGTTERLVTALVAVNVGPLLLAWGSLANLLWLRSCRRRGLEVSALGFGLEGLLVVPLAVAAGVLAVRFG
ncbi:arsenite efflux membrane protein ArsB [Nocardioides scoriae]|uniref:Arsenite efflux membrane protein ArsB n=1 Tax=Nocardioides scoriae TaxID=642780 RepID=A0A1H1Y5A7_9ACTN|nr:SLC13 family permease [Nocardioides scoriae]SDT16409.1 arsenite efflux membrane protein ArsB [Nocardioides scoriae]